MMKNSKVATYNNRGKTCKRILIYDVAAEYGGARTVLLDYYNRFKSLNGCECFFVVSNVKLEDSDNIHIITLHWTKKTWFHRLYCDCFYIQKLVKQFHVDEVISLQNLPISRCKVLQTVYLHNAIPFTEHKFKFKESKFLWFYQNVIGKMIISKLNQADKIIVQTEWMKESVSSKCSVNPEKIFIEKIGANCQPSKRIASNHHRFFFPGGPMIYKNHKVIIEACEILKKQGINNYLVFFTLVHGSGTYTDSIEKQISNEELPIKLVGHLSQNQMTEMYCQSTLIFPSYLETVGLPLIEAIYYGCNIIVADCKYAHEAVGDYDNVKWFEYDDAELLANIMIDDIQNT